MESEIEEGKTMRQGAMGVLLLAAVVLVLAGCGDFRRQAEEAQTRIASAEETAQIAEQAAAQNAVRILELQDRVEALELQLDELLLRSEGETEEALQRSAARPPWIPQLGDLR
jgi:uncharacterized protein HemX